MEDAGAKVGCVNSLRPRRRDAAPSMGRGTRSLTNREFWLFVASPGGKRSWGKDEHCARPRHQHGAEVYGQTPTQSCGPSSETSGYRPLKRGRPRRANSSGAQ